MGTQSSQKDKNNMGSNGINQSCLSPFNLNHSTPENEREWQGDFKGKPFCLHRK